MPYCPNCGDEESAEARFCGNCGQTLTPATQTAAPARHKPFPWWAVVVAASGMAVVTIVVLVATRN